MDIDRTLASKKADLLRYYRDRAVEFTAEVQRLYGAQDYKKQAAGLNRAMVECRADLCQAVLQKAQAERWTNADLLPIILLFTYTAYVVMLEARNDVWQYEYMTFSRRIGELWEPFCRLCVDYPIADIELFVPPTFADIKRDLTNEMLDYISKLNITQEQKNELTRYYNKVWALVSSGAVQMALDAHIIKRDCKINIDFKSGFGSNEKGNTNRLLLVGTIYRNLPDNYRCMLLVRCNEDQNNHYFQTLKNSGIWEAYCGDAAYEQLGEITGFPLKDWIRDNIEWKRDMQSSTVQHLIAHNLDGYLRW